MDFNKPEYLYRPSSALRRSVPNHLVIVRLPWGLDITVDPSQDIGRAVYLKGVCDLPLTEALWRLAEPGSVVYDVGANVGYASAVLASRGAGVFAFEPHPDIFPRLESNARRWPRVRTFPLALSDRDGTARMSDPPAGNDGMAALSDFGPREVECRRVDSLALPSPSLVKLDVEGHELSALRGAGDVLGRVRDIIFEEHAPYPSPVTHLLESAGYSVFNLGVSLFGPLLCPPSRPRNRRWEPPNYLATREPGRARALFKRRGWRCLTC